MRGIFGDDDSPDEFVVSFIANGRGSENFYRDSPPQVLAFERTALMEVLGSFLSNFVSSLKPDEDVLLESLPRFHTSERAEAK